MNGRRVSGAVAALFAAAAVLSGAARARADELSDLRANSQLLQQRLDQIRRAQAPPADSAAAPGSFPRSFLIPGTNTSVRVGGNATETLQYRLQDGR